MRFVDVIKQYKLPLVVGLLVIFIVVLLAVILLINPGHGPNKSISVNYVGYDAFKQQVEATSADPNLSQSPHLAKFLSFIQPIEDNTKSEKDRYKALTNGFVEVLYLYTFSSNPKARLLLDAINTFVKNNFPKEYKPNSFKYPCQDPTCADSKPDQKFIDIINELKNSDLPAAVKTDMAQYLQSLTYYSKNSTKAKAQMILMTANNFRNYNAMSKTGANVKIADDLTNYVKDNYPVEYKSLTLPKPNPTTTKP